MVHCRCTHTLLINVLCGQVSVIWGASGSIHSNTFSNNARGPLEVHEGLLCALSLTQTLGYTLILTPNLPLHDGLGFCVIINPNASTLYIIITTNFHTVIMLLVTLPVKVHIHEDCDPAVGGNTGIFSAAQTRQQNLNSGKGNSTTGK